MTMQTDSNSSMVAVKRILGLLLITIGGLGVIIFSILWLSGHAFDNTGWNAALLLLEFIATMLGILFLASGDGKPGDRPIWIYIVNFAVLTLLGLAVVIAANMGMNFAFEKSPKFRSAMRADWTSNKVYSLSPSTIKMLGQIDSEDKPWELDLIDVQGSAEDPLSTITSTQLKDLMEEYASHSRMITFRSYSSSDVEDLDQKIRDRYTDEIKPYDAALNDTDKTLKDAKAFFTSEGELLGALSTAPGVSEGERALWQRMQSQFEKTISGGLDSYHTKISKEMNSTLPEYSKTKDEAQSVIDGITDMLQQLISVPDSPDFKSFSDPAKKYFADGLPRYKDELEKMQKIGRTIGDLKPLEMDAIRGSIQSKSIVIFAPKTIQVVSLSDMTKVDYGDPNANKPPVVTFNGEQGVSSAMLKIVRPDRPKIVFISAQAANLVHGDNSEFADRLAAANFDVSEWAPGGQEPAPQFSGKGVVYVVFPPPAFDMQAMQMGQPQPNSGEMVKAVQRHIAKGGNVLFLAEASQPAMMPGMGGDTGYPFNPLLQQFGIDVRSQFTIVGEKDTPDGDVQTLPLVQTDRFEDSEITDPVKGLPSVFLMNQRMGGGPAPIDIKKDTPDITITPLIKLSAADYWGTTSVGQHTKRSETDFQGPLYLGVAAEKKLGPDTVRVVVFGNAQFASNYVMQAPDQYGYPRFPGNGELLANATMWLAGYDNMIAVSSRALAAQRIKEISWQKLLTLDLIMILGVPLLLLAAGGTVYFVRRR